MQRLIDKGMSPEEAAVKVANSKQNGKPLMGGNLLPEDCVSIYNNKGLERLEQHSQERKNKMVRKETTKKERDFLSKTYKDDKGYLRFKNKDELLIYPNPVTDILTINGSSEVDVDIYDMVGNLVVSEQDAKQINMTKLPSGIYNLNILYNGVKLNQRVVKR